MITKITTVDELKQIFTEILLNKTSAVTKISDGSAVNGVAFGAAKIGQKTMKDVAVLEAHLFTDSGFGDTLDRSARLNGVSERFGARQSSTYMRVEGDVGTTYLPQTNTFVSTGGVIFDIVNQYTIGVFGYGYVKVRSRTTGSNTNVPALSINTITNPPSGHNYCVNDYQALYGSDFENDDEFRKRSQDGPNSLARGTIAMIEQCFQKINNNVLRVFYSGIDSNSRVILSILTENGIDLTSEEINDVLIRGEKFFNLTEMRPVSYNGFGVTIQNVLFQPIDISMRIDIERSYNVDQVRIDMQTRINKYLDYRYWRVGQKVEWDNLLEIVKHTDGVKYVNDSFFFPNNDIAIDVYKLPRIRGFQMLDLNGNLIKDIQGVLNPVFYPNEIDFMYQASVLRSI